MKQIYMAYIVLSLVSSKVGILRHVQVAEHLDIVLLVLEYREALE